MQNNNDGLEKVEIVTAKQTVQVQGVENPNEAYLVYAAMRGDAAQRRNWTSYEAIHNTQSHFSQWPVDNFESSVV